MIGTGALGIWMHIDPAGEADFNAWYPRQHLPERLSVPGFLRGRRYAAVGEAPPYFTLYEVETPAVLGSAPYLERLNDPTDWTRRTLPSFRVMVRNAYALLAASAPDRAQRHLLTVRIKPDSGRGPAVRTWIAGEGVAMASALDGVSGCGFYVSETAASSLVTEERRLVGGEVLAAPPFLAVCEVADPSAEAALRQAWGAWARRLGTEATVDLYRLMYGLGWIQV